MTPRTTRVARVPAMACRWRRTPAGDVELVSLALAITWANVYAWTGRPGGVINHGQAVPA